jgi:two-component system, NtrC family, sensor kinase
VFRFDGQLVYFAAAHGTRPDAIDAMRSRFPLPPGRGFAAGRAILSNAIEEIPDLNADADYALREVAIAGAYGSLVAVPIRKDGRPIGALAVGRSRVGHFPDRQVLLLETFADQAVIAIENTRLFEEVQTRIRELTESLEQQTATSEVLSVISTSPGELAPVFEAMLSNVVRIWGAKLGILFRSEGDAFRAVALHDASRSFAEER